MHIKQILLIVLKEVRINYFLIIFTSLTPILFIILSLFISSYYSSKLEVHDCIYCINRISILIPILYGEYFINKEMKSKTFILLRTMPLSEFHIFLGKNMIGWLSITVANIPGIIFLSINFDKIPILSYALIIFSFLAMATSSIICLVIKLGHRITFLLVNAGAVTAVYLWTEFEDIHPLMAENLSNNQLILGLLSLINIFGTYFFFRVGLKHFFMKDTRELVT